MKYLTKQVTVDSAVESIQNRTSGTCVKKAFPNRLDAVSGDYFWFRFSSRQIATVLTGLVEDDLISALFVILDENGPAVVFTKQRTSGE